MITSHFVKICLKAAKRLETKFYAPFIAFFNSGNGKFETRERSRVVTPIHRVLDISVITSLDLPTSKHSIF